MPSQDELFAAVDALLEGEPELPPPAERARLREAAGITQSRLAQVLQTSTQTVKNWENGRSEPRPPRRQAYQRLLDGWAAKYPGPDAEAAAPPEPAAATPPAAPHEPPAAAPASTASAVTHQDAAPPAPSATASPAHVSPAGPPRWPPEQVPPPWCRRPPRPQ
nr:helix-turn-helix domain-containing protein [Streptomyces pactum]